MWLLLLILDEILRCDHSNLSRTLKPCFVIIDKKHSWGNEMNCNNKYLRSGVAD